MTAYDLYHPKTDGRLALGLQRRRCTSIYITKLAEPAGRGPDDLGARMSPQITRYIPVRRRGRLCCHALARWPTGKRCGLKAGDPADRRVFAMSGTDRMHGPGQGFWDGYPPLAVIDRQPQLADECIVRGRFGNCGAACADRRWLCHSGRNAYIGNRRGFWAVTPICWEFTSASVLGSASADDFIAQPAARIGGDGFSFVWTAEPSTVEQTPQDPWRSRRHKSATMDPYSTRFGIVDHRE